MVSEAVETSMRREYWGRVAALYRFVRLGSYDMVSAMGSEGRRHVPKMAYSMSLTCPLGKLYAALEMSTLASLIGSPLEH